MFYCIYFKCKLLDCRRGNIKRNIEIRSKNLIRNISLSYERFNWRFMVGSSKYVGPASLQEAFFDFEKKSIDNNYLV
jgi:hypothetical protein